MNTWSKKRVSVLAIAGTFGWVATATEALVVTGAGLATGVVDLQNLAFYNL